MVKGSEPKCTGMRGNARMMQQQQQLQKKQRASSHTYLGRAHAWPPACVPIPHHTRLGLGAPHHHCSNFVQHAGEGPSEHGVPIARQATSHQGGGSKAAVCAQGVGSGGGSELLLLLRYPKVDVSE